MDVEKLKYPIGKFEFKENYSLEELLEHVLVIKSLPEKLSKILPNLNESSLHQSYRPGGWSILQIVHHLADSHLNSFLRIKFILHEDNPTIKPYNENDWAAGIDYGYLYDSSYLILLGIHQRMSLLLLDCLKKPELLTRTYYHPENNRTVTLAQHIALYAWHGEQHLAHINLALEGIINSKSN